MDLEQVRSRYQEERPGFEQLARAAADTLRQAGAEARVPFQVEWRAKEIASLLKKTLFGSTKYQRVIDRAGVRIILESVTDLCAVDTLVARHFHIIKKQDKAGALDRNEFGYGGIHYHLEFIALPYDHLPNERFELQVHTRAQALWATLSHRIAYKDQGVGGADLRALHRLAALLELADLEVVRVRQEADRSPRRLAANVTALLESHYVVVGLERYSRETTTALVPLLLPLMGSNNFETWRDDFEAFVRQHEERLRSIYARYREDTRNLLMSQPESLLVLYSRARDPFAFSDRWPEQLGEGLRDSFVGIWPDP